MDPTPTRPIGSCDSPGCGCGPASTGVGTSRRDFIASTGLLLASAGGLRPAGAIAGPFVASGDGFPIPADKKWDAAWVRSLFERGEPRVYRASRHELSWIGFPVGGICCGQLYLSGDGRLWHWDVFNTRQSNEWNSTAGPLYASPAAVASPVEQGLTLRLKSGESTDERSLDARGFAEVEFRGEWPIGLVRYRDARCPVEVDLEAFSPLSPLDVAFSSLPATLMRVTVRNASKERVEVEVAARLANAVCISSGEMGRGRRVNQVVRRPGFTAVACSAEPAPLKERHPQRPDEPLEDFEKGTYEGWTVTGTAFGDRPRNLRDIAAYQAHLNAQGEWVVNSHDTRQAGETAPDTHIGTLLSRPFVLSRDWVSFRIGGGNHPGQTCVNLLIDGAPVRTATGQNNNRMRVENWDVREFAGREAQFQIVDGYRGGWGNVGCDDIILTDEPRVDRVVLSEQPDFGSMAVAVLGAGDATTAAADAGDAEQARVAFPERPLATVTGKAVLAAGEAAELKFVYAWHFPMPLRTELGFLSGIESLRRHYAKDYADALAVVARIAAEADEMTRRTRLWRDTWYDSTLPLWFLDRTMANTSTLATATCHLFDSGRFYAWEGTHCCAGTCTHVWQYAHSVARLFPQLERSLREMVDFGAEFDEKTGIVHYRGEAAHELAVDGQAGVILRAYREHQMSADDSMLRKIWPRVRRATECLLERDTDGDGLLDGPQYNTLDTTWWGQIAWISSLFIAAVRAAAAMAAEVGDEAFAASCRDRAERGSRSMTERLYDGEYFIQLHDAAHPEANRTATGCHADQLLGQFWTEQLGLERIVPREQTVSALRALYRYNLAPDIGVYRRRFDPLIKGGRWYAMPGEGGLLLCTWPRGGAESATGAGSDGWAAGYFNECWTGFEHHVAAQMLADGLVLEGLAVERLVHDRHDAARRNPWNEVECSSHYARAMSSYGTYVSACGFEYHGPAGHVGFTPRLSPEKFKAAFVAAEGWGSFEQTRAAGGLTASLRIVWGKLRLRRLALELAEGTRATGGSATLNGREEKIRVAADGPRAIVEFDDWVTIEAGAELRVELKSSA
ncbi:MAG: hypothetical protein CHACPFDD_01772 [Phycisphaerae bacterium]|nr:hypothetical protein [Phycisphaerae bacterium]